MSSSIPAAIQAFMAVATAALPGDALVWFGKTLPEKVPAVTLQVTGTVNGRQRARSIGPAYLRDEEYEFACELVCWAGDSDFMQLMLNTFANFSLLTVAIGNNPTLNQAVRYTQITQLNFTPEAYGNGTSSGTLAFNVNCQKIIESLT